MEPAEVDALMQPGDLPALATLALRPAWQRRAACLGMGTELFFADGGPASEPAKAICAGCPVRRECHELAAGDISLVGVWGGTTVAERRRGRHRRAAAA